MTVPTPQGLEGFQNPTQGYVRQPKLHRSDGLSNMTCKRCESNLVYRTLNYLYTKALPFNCVNCVLIPESEVIQGGN